MLIPQAIVQQGGSGGAWSVIHDETLGSAGTFDVSGIAGTYAALDIRLLVRSDRAGQVQDAVAMRFNNDSGNNYRMEGFQGAGGGGFFAEQGANTQFSNSTSLPYVGTMPAATSDAGAVGWTRIEIPEYAGTTFWKMFNSQWGGLLDTAGGNLRDGSSSGWWMSTAAITRIAIYSATASNFITGSRLTILALTV